MISLALNSFASDGKLEYLSQSCLVKDSFKTIAYCGIIARNATGTLQCAVSCTERFGSYEPNTYCYAGKLFNHGYEPGWDSKIIDDKELVYFYYNRLRWIKKKQ
jgi:hypothetical protein